MRLDRHSRTACLKQSEFFSGQASGIHRLLVQPEAVFSLVSFFLKRPGSAFSTAFLRLCRPPQYLCRAAYGILILILATAGRQHASVHQRLAGAKQALT
jgi:hypothetical protein